MPLGISQYLRGPIDVPVESPSELEWTDPYGYIQVRIFRYQSFICLDAVQEVRGIIRECENYGPVLETSL